MLQSTFYYQAAIECFSRVKEFPQDIILGVRFQSKNMNCMGPQQSEQEHRTWNQTTWVQKSAQPLDIYVSAMIGLKLPDPLGIEVMMKGDGVCRVHDTHLANRQNTVVFLLFLFLVFLNLSLLILRVLSPFLLKSTNL